MYTDEQVGAMLAVSRVVARGDSLPVTLDAIAALAAGVADGARATSIMLMTTPGEPWLIAGAHGLSDGYRQLAQEWPTLPRRGRTLTQLLLEPGRPIVVDDTEADARFEVWRGIARAERFRGFLSVPLGGGEGWLGALNVYRSAPGPWARAQIELMTFFGEHAASAIRAAQLLDRQKREVVGLRRLVRVLEEQGHEHSNRLHTVAGLLSLDAVAEAREFLDELEVAHHDRTAAVRSRISHPILTGLLLAESAIAHQRSIELEIDPASHVDVVPQALGDAQLVTIVGNLLDNAFDAVAHLPAQRRRVALLLRADAERATILVRDWGEGLPAEFEQIFERGVSSKGGHPGVGLALVQDSIRAANGSIDVRRHVQGTSFAVAVPRA
ncbi:ATP-binding protein [Conexibacter sp. CPCC 206217]|uniref:ATP-binding protein n=1 Tax=Conexibacter sp. CPCC 206217 TaxID=3064574 RepID=UPI002726519D|nr:ATP-binding protein [Conexibacter sp. CPCC 206217]MDO8210229.1 GAF domain-containing protein [Conexibacter sp. CPCC 206217]